MSIFTSAFTNKLSPCVHLRLRCPEHGAIRFTTAAVPETLFCPRCDQSVPSDYLGSGATTRPMPFWEAEGDHITQTQKPPQHKNSRPIAHGQLVVFFAEPNVLYFGRAVQLWTGMRDIRDNLPSLTIEIGDSLTERVPYSAAREVFPCWCFPEDVQTVKQAEKKGGKRR